MNAEHGDSTPPTVDHRGVPDAIHSLDIPPAKSGDEAVHGSRYRPLRLHAKGGLGEVYFAHDEECDREVAVKTIQAERLADSANRARFLREAKITALLQHPGVVPIYGMGVGPDGRPHYAMRFITGETLEDAVRRFHVADVQKRSAADRGLALRQLLNHFVAVCQTVGYAHSRGVVHCDLKPENIMIGLHGETLVVDWGLARFTRQQAEPAAAGDRPLISEDPAEGLTVPGQVLGTPAYM